MRLLPNPGLSKPSKSDKAVTAERSQKQIWAPGEGTSLWWEGRTQNILTPGQQSYSCTRARVCASRGTQSQHHQTPFKSTPSPSELLVFCHHCLTSCCTTNGELNDCKYNLTFLQRSISDVITKQLPDSIPFHCSPSISAPEFITRRILFFLCSNAAFCGFYSFSSF